MRPKSSRAIFAVIAVVAVAIVGGLVLLVSVLSGPVTDEQRAANARTASSSSDFGIVCIDGSISNAAPFAKPYKILAFSDNPPFSFIGDSTDHWSKETLTGDFSGELGPPDAVNTVACLSKKPETETRGKSCEFTSGDHTVTADLYSVQYEIELREAKTGKLIKDLGTVDGPGDHCPILASFRRSVPRIYGSPDHDALDAKLNDFAKG